MVKQWKSTPHDAAETGIDAASRDLLVLIPRLMSGLKRAGSRPPRAIADAGELGPRHFRALIHLALDGEMTVGALARRLGISLAGASLIVAELARAGVVERRDDEADRRRTLVRVAPDHAEWVGEVVESRAEPMGRFLATLAPPEREAFLAHLALLADALADAAGPSGPSGPSGADC